MKPKLYSYLAIVLFAAIFIVACKKGDTGPAGPAGPAGAAGASGSAGPKGDSGTANVIYSAWIDGSFTPEVYQDPSVPGQLDTLDFADTLSAPKITSTILTQGDIKVYFNYGSAAAPDIIPVPFTDVFLNISVEFQVGKILLYSSANLTTQTQGGVKYGQFRYVILPGSVPASVNVKDYNAVKNYFKLPD
jgi:hypothetical protein